MGSPHCFLTSDNGPMITSWKLIVAMKLLDSGNGERDVNRRANVLETYKGGLYTTIVINRSFQNLAHNIQGTRTYLVVDATEILANDAQEDELNTTEEEHQDQRGSLADDSTDENT